MVGLIASTSIGHANLPPMFRPVVARGSSDLKSTADAAAAGTPASDNATTDGQNPKAKTDGVQDPSAPKGPNGKPLSKDQQRVVAELKSRDRDVRAHEAAHKAVGGSLAGGISLSYQIGPDGQTYAVGGEVSIDTGAERDPNATIAKMQRVIAAALAPADPSSQDRAVAAAASATETDAQRQLSEQQGAKLKESMAQPDKAQAAMTGSTATGQAGTSASGATTSGFLVTRAYNAQPNDPGSKLNLII